MVTELYHHGIKGQKWGVRRYQNPDGSYTELGKNVRRSKRYMSGDRISNENTKNVKTINAKNVYITDLNTVLKEKGKKWIDEKTDNGWDDKWLNSHKGKVAIDKGRDVIAGYIFVDTNLKKHPNYIAPLRVLPEYRRNGIGTKLLDEVNKDYDETNLAVWIDNKAAVNMYNKAGYVREGEKFYKKNGEAYAGVYYMKKKNK